MVMVRPSSFGGASIRGSRVHRKPARGFVLGRWPAAAVRSTTSAAATTAATGSAATGSAATGSAAAPASTVMTIVPPAASRRCLEVDDVGELAHFGCLRRRALELHYGHLAHALEPIADQAQCIDEARRALLVDMQPLHQHRDLGRLARAL